jgi:hypothetical protein
MRQPTVLSVMLLLLAQQEPGPQVGCQCLLLPYPFGHRWSVATHVEDVSPDEMAKRAEAMGG